MSDSVRRRRIFAGKIASLREQAQHLRDRVALCQISFDRHPSHHNEIERARAEQALADFQAAHPSVQ